MKEQSGTIMSLPSALHCGEPSRWRKASRVLVLKTNVVPFDFDIYLLQIRTRTV